MKKVTLDASVALAWLLEESGPAWLQALLSEVEQGELAAVVPSHFWLEIGNTLSRAQTLSDDQALDGMLRLEALGLETIEVDTPLQLQALRVARETGLTMYDATYLATAQAMGAPLATLDVKLGRASASHGISHTYALDSDGGRERVSDVSSGYGEGLPDLVSLAAIGAALARLRRQNAPM